MTTYHYISEGSTLYWDIQRVYTIFMILINANDHFIQKYFTIQRQNFGLKSINGFIYHLIYVALFDFKLW